jgi:hypothetical protein
VPCFEATIGATIAPYLQARRPPDRPPDTVNVSGGCSLERANTRYHVRQLVSSSCSNISMSGNATPFAANANSLVRTPLYYRASSQADSSYEFDRGLSWMPPRCGRLRRVSSLRYVPHQTQLVQATSDALLPASTQGVLTVPPLPGSMALSGCSREPRWGATK